MWGVIYVESSGSGFAMEFVGDMQDSRIVGNLGELKSGGCGVGTCDVNALTVRPGAGVN
jgi:hypothetical protein